MGSSSLDTQHSARLMDRTRDLVLLNGHLNLLAWAAQPQGRAHKPVRISASGNCEASNGGGYGKDPIEMQRGKGSVTRKSRGMSLEEILVTGS